MILGIIGPTGVIAAVAIIVTLIVIALLKILKNEKGWWKLVWILIVLSIPFVGALVYLIYSSLKQKSRVD
jgi:uncharacterized BrkB/YihY/UPF0761 family membrane protein